MSLAIFDLDNTLLSGDSDYLWGEFLTDQGLVDGEFYRKENQRFYDAYKEGELDIFEFLAFSLKPLAENSLSSLNALHQQFMAERIEPIILPAAKALIDQHRQAGDTLMIITATNRFVTGPIAARLGIDNLLATEPEMVNGEYTGKVEGTPCFQDGKVTRLNEWLRTNQCSLDGSWFYSDSHNDIPLLKMVSHAVAVDADERLTEFATSQGWQQISLRETD